MTTDAAHKAVLNTSELLESILVYLPPKTLFGVQRVSKQFQAIITTSIPIQEKMFLRLRNKPQQSWSLKGKPNASGYNPYFVECASSSPDPILRKPTELNPFLKLDSYYYYKGSSCAERVWNHPTEFINLPFDQPMSLTTLRTAPPSILRTYICDPPSGDFNIHYNYRFPQSGIMVYQDKVEGVESSRTIGDIVRNVLGSDGRARIGLYLEELNKTPNYTRWENDSRGGILHPGLVVQKYEYMLNATAKLATGISKVCFKIRDMVIPTDDERAAVKSRDKEG